METPKLVEHNGRKYRVKPSAFGGYSVVEVLPSGLARPVRNVAERAAVIAKATGSAA
jgi:hypothetical protein